MTTERNSIDNETTAGKETLLEVRGLRGEVSEINRYQADLKTDQAAMLRDIHHMNLQMVNQAHSIKEMATAMLKVAAVSEKIDRANQDINFLVKKQRHLEDEMTSQKEKVSEDRLETRDLISAAAIERATMKEILGSHNKEIHSAKWLFGGILLMVIGTFVKLFIGG